ncbi:7654_t:CDS:10 [Scutellospora calospora]|uniref:7654_t:CDS:1 n=1 Tax=Scutellospora calospora TaxID=85575 RepID=A0ACA9JW37_9GLOM|nr:7654_t:CDS:10 [Scutellospora calospora]
MDTTYTNYNTDDVNPNPNEINLQFRYNDLNCSLLLMDTSRQQNVSGKNTSGTDGYQSIPSFTLPNDMLPTPNGSDHNACSESIIMSPYTMLPEGTFREDESYMPGYLSSPLTSPTLQPDQSIIRQKSNTTYNQIPNNQHYSPLNKQKAINNSMTQIPGKNSSSDNNNSIENSNNTKNNVNKLPTIMTGSPPMMPNVSMSLNDFASSLLSTNMQETMPNLNLGSNLVSEVTSTQPSSTHLSNGSSSSLNAPRSRVAASGSQRMLVVSPNVSPISPGMNPGTMSPIILPSSGRRIVQPVCSPSALNPSKSPQTLKPTISPSLKPKLPGVLVDEVAEKLASQSNYKNILEGTSKSLGISYSSDVHSSLESRRTTHKAAEQKRRDSLKQSFDELKKVVPLHSVTSNNTKGNNNKNSNGNDRNVTKVKSCDSNGSLKNVSKLLLLKRAHDHIVELHQQTKEKDELIQKLTNELDELKIKLCPIGKKNLKKWKHTDVIKFLQEKEYFGFDERKISSPRSIKAKSEASTESGSHTQQPFLPYTFSKMRDLFDLKTDSYNQLPQFKGESLLVNIANAATRRELISRIIYDVGSIYNGNVKIYSQYEVSGSHGKGPIDWVIKVEDTVTEAKKEDINPGVAQKCCSYDKKRNHYEADLYEDVIYCIVSTGEARKINLENRSSDGNRNGISEDGKVEIKEVHVEELFADRIFYQLILNEENVFSG